MNAFLRNLGHDFVDKKLWPLALALVVALVAVPMLLGGGGEAPVAPAPATPGATASTATSPEAAAPAGEVAVAVEEPLLRKGEGAVRDPFKQQYVPKDTTAIAVEAPKTTGTSTGTTKPSTGSTGGTTTPSTPSTPTAPKSKGGGDPLDVYRVALRFGQPGGQKTMRDIARLSPLPNADRPFFVFLGVLSGGKKAVFLVSSDAEATGDGSCRPSKTNCETVELEPGETEFFDLETDSGVVQYQLDLLSVTRRDTNTRLVAVPAKAKPKSSAPSGKKLTVEKQGSESADDDLGTDAYRWDDDRGVLVRRNASARVSMNIGGGLLSALRAASDDLADLTDGAWHPDPEGSEDPIVIGTE